MKYTAGHFPSECDSRVFSSSSVYGFASANTDVHVLRIWCGIAMVLANIALDVTFPEAKMRLQLTS